MCRPAEFMLSESDEPHLSRRLAIMKKHPEVKKLFGYEPLTKYVVAATVCLQVVMSIATREWRWYYWLAGIYVVGATTTHSLFLAIHELSHNLGAKTPRENKIIALFANLPITIAYCITFKPFHMAHHRYQGQPSDTDIPTRIEAYLVTSSAGSYADHVARKATFMFFQILAYALRPMFVKPELVPTKDGWLAVNWVCCLAFDAALFLSFGPVPIFYLLLSTFFAGSIHPTAGHFIAEHHVTDGVCETYSYYGCLNSLAYNVGYHNEHHDFPNIPWSRLPKLKKLAPEFYDDLPQCKSWPGIILTYIFDDTISPFSRVKRSASVIPANAPTTADGLDKQKST